jgi:dihydroorotase
MYCLPVAKRETHRLALRAAVTGGSDRFFLGSDSAPHPVVDKERDCGCAGIFTAPAALEIYAQVFAEAGALDRLEAFASLNGARFYGLPANPARITLVRRRWTVPQEVSSGAGPLRPFLAGESLDWQIAD